MKNRIFRVVLVLLVAGAVWGYLLRDDPITRHERMETPAQPLSVTEPSVMPTNGIPASFSMPVSTVAKAVERKNEDTGKEDIYKMFQADGRGNLVLNESTRLNIESLYALNTQEELEAKLQKLSTVLPPKAHRQLVNSINYFNNYIVASKKIYSPDVAPLNVEDALDQLEGLHSLRESYFGSDMAKAFFAEEEKLNRQLLELMRLEKDKNMTMAEKAQNAQLLIKSNPEPATLNNPDRGNGSIKHNIDSTDH